MMVTTSVSREVRVAALPAGLPQPADLTVAEIPVPEPGPGQVLVRNRYFSVFAALRTLLGGSVPGAPFPALKPGDTLFGRAPIAPLAPTTSTLMKTPCLGQVQASSW